ncbi:MAG: peptide deformylase [Janthinobacterium lividum]
MAEALQLIYAPNVIFRIKAELVEVVNDEIRLLADRMIKTLQAEGAVGLAANMVGISKRIAIVSANPSENLSFLVLINPEIVWVSKEHQSFKEASLCFPGISAKISRPKAIKVKYIDYNGNSKELEAEGFLATIIQHKVDYLDGKIYLDYLSKLKADTLLKKMQKHVKQHPPHIHSSHCRH